MNNLKVVFIAAIIGALVGSFTTSTLLTKQAPVTQKPNQDEMIKDYYLTETAVHVSPHGLRRKMDKGDKSFILVDLRSAQEYEKEHIIGAVNIPAYKDPDTSAYEEVDRIVSEFKQLPENKDVIVYCYSIPCMTGRKVGKMLAENGIYVKQLGVGWNEWRHFWQLWNHEHEWELTNPEDYITSGPEPGTPEVRELPSPCGIGDLGC
jgi:rhodanese-related sulfurtransferase